jgi:hypothetical protein
MYTGNASAASLLLPVRIYLLPRSKQCQFKQILSLSLFLSLSFSLSLHLYLSLSLSLSLPLSLCVSNVNLNKSAIHQQFLIIKCAFCV